jgi:citrate lyase subunit gamma (acyl carrier protein)
MCALTGISLTKDGMRMEIVKTAVAGTLESSDVQVTIEPDAGISIDISSIVLNQYGRQIKAVVLDTLNSLGVKSAKVTLVDKGALDCTIKARVEYAVYKAAEFTGNIPWGGRHGK